MTSASPACDNAEVDQLRAELEAAHRKIANLELALHSNRRIGAAVGIVMCQHHVTEEQAFALMVGVSQRRHRKIRDLADEIVLTGSLPA